MSTKQLIVGATGIYVAYLSSSLIYERLYSYEYPNGEGQAHRFEYPQLCVWVGCLMCALFGMIKSHLTKEPKNPLPPKQHLILGVLYTLNILAANAALVYVSFLTQTIGRNCRYLLVVIVGAFFSRVTAKASIKLKPKKVIVALVITAAVMLFTLMKDVHVPKMQSNKGGQSFDPTEEWKGYVLLAISVMSDALFSDSQAYAKVNFKPTANHLFTSANFLTFLFVISISLFAGKLGDQIWFCTEHPLVLLDILGAGCLQVLGQVSIYFVIANFKQHIFPLISTTRKVFTVLLSIFIYNHSINLWQWFSIVFVFGGLGYELRQQINAKKAKAEKHKE